MMKFLFNLSFMITSATEQKTTPFKSYSHEDGGTSSPYSYSGTACGTSDASVCDAPAGLGDGRRSNQTALLLERNSREKPGRDTPGLFLSLYGRYECGKMRPMSRWLNVNMLIYIL